VGNAIPDTSAELAVNSLWATLAVFMIPSCENVAGFCGSRNILTERAKKVSGAPGPLAPHPQRWQNQIMAAVAGVSAEPLSRPPPGHWRAGVTAAGTPLATDQTWRQRGRRLIMVALASMPSGRESPPVARPRGLPAEKRWAKLGENRPDGFAPGAFRPRPGPAPQTAGPSYPRTAYGGTREKV